MVVAEALACQCPVLVSDQVNIWREVVEGGAGVAGPDTIDGMTGLLSRWIAFSQAERTACRARTRSVYERHFHIAAAAERIRALCIAPLQLA